MLTYRITLMKLRLYNDIISTISIKIYKGADFLTSYNFTEDILKSIYKFKSHKDSGCIYAVYNNNTTVSVYENICFPNVYTDYVVKTLNYALARIKMSMKTTDNLDQYSDSSLKI